MTGYEQDILVALRSVAKSAERIADALVEANQIAREAAERVEHFSATLEEIEVEPA